MHRGIAADMITMDMIAAAPDTMKDTGMDSTTAVDSITAVVDSITAAVADSAGTDLYDRASAPQGLSEKEQIKYLLYRLVNGECASVL